MHNNENNLDPQIREIIDAMFNTVVEKLMLSESEDRFYILQIFRELEHNESAFAYFMQKASYAMLASFASVCQLSNSSRVSSMVKSAGEFNTIQIVASIPSEVITAKTLGEIGDRIANELHAVINSHSGSVK